MASSPDWSPTHWPQLVAHRGAPRDYPENSLEGYRAALVAGARWVETDIQLSQDGEPMLFHDDSLERMTGRVERIGDLSAIALGSLPLRWPDTASSAQIATIGRLSDWVALLANHPHVGAFVELKCESLARWGLEQVISTVALHVARIRQQVAIIGRNREMLVAARDQGFRIGWVVGRWDAAYQAWAENLRPDWLIVNDRRLPTEARGLWPGPWQWMVYTIDDAHRAHEQPARGIGWVETDAILSLLRDPRWHNAHTA